MRLDFIKPLVPYMPEVKSPTRMPTFKEKLIWTGVALLLFFVMYNLVPFGGEVRGGQFVEFIQVVLASRTGTLLTIGIGPIILASILLQLLAGAKIIEFDKNDANDKALFSTTQKTVAIILAIVESYIFVAPGLYLGPSAGVAAALGIPVAFLLALIILQIAAASILLIFVDEIVSKYGIGSGISLFIAAGVAMAVVQGGLTIIIGSSAIDPSQTVLGRLSAGGATAISGAIVALLPLIFTFLIIIASIYAEEVKVEIPLAFDRIRGFESRFPIKLLYVSVLPVIIASALLLNVQLLARSLLFNAEWMIDGTNVLNYIGVIGANGQLVDGFLYLLTPFQNPLFIGYEAYLATLAGVTPLGIPQYVHVIVYAIVYVGLCVFFGKFWVEVTGMGASAVADQIRSAGMQLPGFRRDPRIIEKMLSRYISTITVLGSIFVGLLAVIADMTGAIGSGTGILLTVGIIHKFYEDFKSQKVFDMYPRVQKFFEG